LVFDHLEIRPHFLRSADNGPMARQQVFHIQVTDLSDTLLQEAAIPAGKIGSSDPAVEDDIAGKQDLSFGPVQADGTFPFSISEFDAEMNHRHEDSTQRFQHILVRGTLQQASQRSHHQIGIVGLEVRGYQILLKLARTLLQKR
jgi:hypothetical protein